MEYIFYKVGIAEYQNLSYEPGPELTSQDDPTREEVMELLEIQAPNYFANLDNLYNNKHVIRVEEIGVGYTYWMLTPISIAYQAERIQNAKANIRTSIISKGGTITTEERLDKYADAISAIATAKVEQEKTVSNPNFSAGDVVVTPDANKVLSKATVKKDANLVAGNIKDGITLYGIQGSLLPAKEEETKTISNADFSSGNLVINPTGNKVMTKVTINKDTNLTTKNIKDGVTIFGVEGDYEGEGGGGLIPGQAINPFPVMFLDLYETRGRVYEADDINGTNETLIFEEIAYSSKTVVIPLTVNKYYKVESFAEIPARAGKIIKYNTQPLSIQDWSNTYTRKKAEETTAMFVQCWDDD